MSGSDFYPPLGYNAPSWPGLSYAPFSITQDNLGNRDKFLYGQDVVMRFTIIWMIICFTTVYGIAAVVAYVAFFPKKRIFILIAFDFFIALAGASIAGSVIGALLWAFYQAGLFNMQTWVPLGWALVASLTAIVLSYPEIGFLTFFTIGCVTLIASFNIPAID